MDAAAPQASIAIVSSITQFAPEPPRLDRYRNELAAGLLGIPAIKANTEGLLSLRKLSATAPDPESDVVFLPQPRAVNVVKAFQQWITSDEDVDEEVESEMTLIFLPSRTPLTESFGCSLGIYVRHHRKQPGGESMLSSEVNQI
jgi:hypothetical protein